VSATDIVCFAKDWSEDPTSCNHVMRALSRHVRVLWLESVCTRRPDLGSGRDLRKIVRKLVAFLRGPRQVEPNLWVFTPLVLPFPGAPAAIAVNRIILRITVALLRRRLGIGHFQLWTFLPTTAAYVGLLGESLAVYYCTDEWSAFPHLDGAQVAAAERALCRKVDVVFATSPPLVEGKAAFNPETHLAPHGVDHAHFASALDDRTPVAAELVSLPRPIVGFFGLVEGWIDLGLLAHVAERRPDWSIVLVGRVAVDVSALRAHPNVHFLGRQAYADLPRYAKAFDVAVCPFVRGVLSRSVDPIKLREYLSAGIPVVASGIPERAALARDCWHADDAGAFLAACEAALSRDSPEERRKRSDARRGDTWRVRVEETWRTTLRVLDAKRRGGDRAGAGEATGFAGREAEA
jgi:glycosyltransferase involved in cell wall biosynthesis